MVFLEAVEIKLLNLLYPFSIEEGFFLIKPVQKN